MKPITKAVLWILLVFLAGTLFGGGMTSLLIVPPPSAERGAAREGSDAPRGRQRGPSMLDRLNTALELDADQKEQVRAILEDGRKRYHEIESESEKAKRKRYGEVRDQNRDRIRALLRAEQVARFEAFLDQLHREWEQRRARREAEQGEGRR